MSDTNSKQISYSSVLSGTASEDEQKLRAQRRRNPDEGNVVQSQIAYQEELHAHRSGTRASRTKCKVQHAIRKWMMQGTVPFISLRETPTVTVQYCTGTVLYSTIPRSR